MTRYEVTSLMGTPVKIRYSKRNTCITENWYYAQDLTLSSPAECHIDSAKGTVIGKTCRE